MKKYDIILFDLDGTLLDSLDDMTDSVNHVMEKFGYPQHTREEVRSFIGNGIRKLIERALPEGTEEAICEEALAEYRRFYNGHCMVKTRPYDGVEEMLRTLKARGYRLAIVSNKNDEAVQRMHHHYFPDTIEVALGQRDGVPKKPDPAMVKEVLNRLKRQDGTAGEADRAEEAQKAVYIGDSEVDIRTAKNAGLDGIICLWGFRPAEFLLEQGAEVTVSSAMDIPDLV